MNRLPRIRLRTVFLLFFCAAVGLATYPDPLAALEPAIAAAMVIGLLQQTRQLWQTGGPELADCLECARMYAIAWRVCLAAVIATCLALALLDRNRFLPFSDAQRIALLFAFLQPVTTISLTTVLCNSLARWRSKSLARASYQHWRWPFWCFAAAVVLLVVVSGSLSTFLTHWGLANIEASIPAPFQRPDVYPEHSREGFRTFWTAGMAVSALIGASAMLLMFTQQRGESSHRLWTLAGGTLLLALPVYFCVRFYTSEFHRVSPDLAGAGLEAGWVDWVFGAALAISLVTAGAYFLGQTSEFRITVSHNLSDEIELTSFHESAAVLLMIAIHAVYSLVLTALSTASAGSGIGPWPVLFFAGMYWYPGTFLLLAQAAAGLQLCWVRFRRRSEKVTWQLVGVSRRSFIENWLVLAMLLVVAVPTLNAFAFAAWLGPFNPRRLFGF